jgi:hypothetical protein
LTIRSAIHAAFPEGGLNTFPFVRFLAGIHGGLSRFRGSLFIKSLAGI